MISVIIPTRNDPLLHQTVESLTHSEGEFEIIVVDDAGGPWNWPDVDQVIRNEYRLGPALARQKGAEAATGDWLMFSDSHMSYNQGWFDVVQSEIANQPPETVFCSTYLADTILDPFWHDTHAIGGADFYWWRHTDHTFSFADLSPRRPIPGLVPCVLGACYVVNRDFFNRIGGFKFMTGYGSEELWLSLAAWATGGRVVCLDNLRVIHRTAASAPPKKVQSRILMPESELNRLAVLRRILPEKLYCEFLSWLPLPDFVKALVLEPPAKIGSFKNIRLLSGDFGLQTFEEALELMKIYHAKRQQQPCDQCGEPNGTLHTMEGATGAHVFACRKCAAILAQNGWRVL